MTATLCGTRQIGGQRDPAQHGIDAIGPVRRDMGPGRAVVGEIAGDDGRARHLGAVDIEDDAGIGVIHRIRRRLARSVVERHAIVQRAPGDRIRHVDRIGEMGDLVLRLGIGEELERVCPAGSRDSAGRRP